MDVEELVGKSIASIDEQQSTVITLDDGTILVVDVKAILEVSTPAQATKGKGGKAQPAAPIEEEEEEEEGEGLSEEDLDDMDLDELTELATEQEVKIPKKIATDEKKVRKFLKDALFEDDDE